VIKKAPHPFLRDPKKQLKQAQKEAKKAAEERSNNIFIDFILQNTGLQLQAEYKPFPDRQHRIDFSSPELKIAVEKEGGIWRKGGGAHSRPQNIERDIYKYTRLGVEGWIIIRRQPKQMKTAETLDLIKQALKQREKQ